MKNIITKIISTILVGSLNIPSLACDALSCRIGFSEAVDVKFEIERLKENWEYFANSERAINKAYTEMAEVIESAPEVVVSIVWEPADWALTIEDIRENGLNWTHGIGLIPAIPGTIRKSIRKESKEIIEKTTKHGAEQLLERRFTQIDILFTKTGRIMTQADGAKVFIKEVGEGKFNVIVEGKLGIITGLKNIDQKAVDKLAKNYGWR